MRELDWPGQAVKYGSTEHLDPERRMANLAAAATSSWLLVQKAAPKKKEKEINK
ncbi:hypothetical protein LX32DRAFT_644609 [Colletotrichum zoysiae]|uniref:Uncharacterized protein n=1 Tax=Colletotrichum zoysiae TaxID=1216348 RepID=A0AAD9LW57_9PEZI|nr:hypothetical protein LX32DRAFT_644609 [Colletotrichum zoysiae]